jgi:uncharacterized lipoprotein
MQSQSNKKHFKASFSSTTQKTSAIFAVLSIAAIAGLLCSCSANNPNRNYAQHRRTIATTVVPKGKGMKSLANKPNFPVPSGKGLAVNPTVSIEPPGSNLSQFHKINYYQAANGARIARVNYYFVKGSNGVPLLILGAPAKTAWKMVADAIARSPYRIVGKDKSLSTYMITLPNSRKNAKLPIYALHVYPQGSSQTVVSISSNKQAFSSSKAILKVIAKSLA